MNTITNYAEYVKAIKERSNFINEKDPLTKMFKNLLSGIPVERDEETEKQIEEMDKAINGFRYSRPFAVYCLSELGAKYNEIGRYTTADEAIKNCPEYDAFVENAITQEEIYRAEDHPNRHTW